MNSIDGGTGLISGGIKAKVGTSNKNVVERLETANRPQLMFYNKTAIMSILAAIKEADSSSDINDEVVAITALKDAAGIFRLAVTTDDGELTPAAPTAASVGVANTAVLAAGTTRKKVILCNTSTATISLGFGGNNAVLDSGATLNAQGGTIVLEGKIAQLEIEGIASLAASNLGIQVFT